jgi:heat shock protein HtpX
MAVNILVVLTISITLNVLIATGILPPIRGITGLLIFCSIFGFAGSFISLALSRVMAKMGMGVKVLDPANPGSPTAAWLVETVHRLATAAGLPVMPEVGVYGSPEVNAFATGPTKSRALVAVSTGLLERMDRDEVEAVLGHEMAHVANGDMVTLALVQGIVNTFVMFFARLAAMFVSSLLRGDRDREGGGGLDFVVNMVLIFVFEIAFSLLGMIAVSWFSRRREFRADEGGARLAGRDKMISALEALKRASGLVDDRAPSLAAFKISGRRGGIRALFSTHPDLDVRIEALRKLTSA